MMSWSTLLKVGMRSLRRRPGYSSMVILCLGAGLAVAVGAGGLTRRVLLDPLPYGSAEELVVLHRSAETGARGGVSFGAYADLAASGIFADVAAVLVPTFDDAIVLTEGPHPERVPGLRVTTSFFRTLAVTPALGRTFDRSLDGESEAILSHEAWRRRWGGSRDVVGATIQVGDRAVRVAGVLPRDFRYDLEPTAEVFLSMDVPPELAGNRDHRILQVVGRTAVPIPPLAGRLEVLDVEIQRAAPWSQAPPLRAAPIRDYFHGDLRRPLLYLAIAGALTLLVAAVDVALLLMARAQERRASDRVRVAFGAARSDLARTAVAEALVLGAAGALLGLIGGAALVRAFGALAPDLVPAEGLRIDAALTTVTLLVALVATGAAAALTAPSGRIEPGALRSRGGSLEPGTMRRWNLLVAAQSALVAFLLVAAGLSARSLDRLLDVDPGFETVESWTLRFALPDGYETLDRIGRYVRLAEQQLEAHPAIDAAGLVSNLPLSPGWFGEFAVRSRDPAAAPADVGWEIASPGYFDAMRIPVLAGRGFRNSDDADAPPVAVVNERLARQYWPEGEAVGARISGTGVEGPWLEVVGVVGDVRQDGLARDVEPMMYVSAGQLFPIPPGQVVVRSAAGAGAAAANAARSTLLEVEPGTVVSGLRGMDDLIRQDTTDTRLQSALLALFGATALFLGLAGLFGVVSFAVNRRRREIGIRIAVGSSHLRVAGRILMSGLVPVALGTGIGLALALLAGSQLQHLLFDVSPADPLVFLSLPLLLVGTATIALLWPAHLAARTDPARVLMVD